MFREIIHLLKYLIIFDTLDCYVGKQYIGTRGSDLFFEIKTCNITIKISKLFTFCNCSAFKLFRIVGIQRYIIFKSLHTKKRKTPEIEADCTKQPGLFLAFTDIQQKIA